MAAWLVDTDLLHLLDPLPGLYYVQTRRHNQGSRRTQVCLIRTRRKQTTNDSRAAATCTQAEKLKQRVEQPLHSCLQDVGCTKRVHIARAGLGPSWEAIAPCGC